MPTPIDVMASAFEDELQKIAQVKRAGWRPKARDVALVGGGGLAAIKGRQAIEDHRNGRLMRKQQQGY